MDGTALSTIVTVTPEALAELESRGGGFIRNVFLGDPTLSSATVRMLVVDLGKDNVFRGTPQKAVGRDPLNARATGLVGLYARFIPEGWTPPERRMFNPSTSQEPTAAQLRLYDEGYFVDWRIWHTLRDPRRFHCVHISEPYIGYGTFPLVFEYMLRGNAGLLGHGWINLN